MRRRPACSRSGRAYTWSNTRISASTQSLKRLLPITPTRSISSSSSSSSNRNSCLIFRFRGSGNAFPRSIWGITSFSSTTGAGAQIPQAALDAVQKHLILRNAQRGGRYRHSVEVDETIQRARQSVAALLNANSADEVAFGMNATSFIRIVSLAIAEIMGARREIIVTDMDHEANIATWL